MYGKKHSEETRDKIREKALGRERIWTDEQREKLSESLTGREFSDEHKKNISKAKEKFPITEEMVEDYLNGIDSKQFCLKYELSYSIWRKLKKKIKENNY